MFDFIEDNVVMSVNINCNSDSMKTTKKIKPGWVIFYFIII